MSAVNEVAIIGVGLHPFGRFEGKSAMQMGVDAIFAAVRDAGIEYRDIQAATGGSWTVANPDAIVAMTGLTGIPFTNVFNACATAASAAKACADGIRLGDYDIGIAIGLDKHPRGAFTEDPALVGMPRWYAENGQYLTTKFFGMKANRYLHDHGISPATLAKVAAKNFRNGALNPNAFRRKPIAEEEILNSPMLNYPLTQYMFCAPDEGAAAVVMCRADITHRYTDKPVYLRAVEVRTRRYGAYEVNTTFAPVVEDVAPTVYAARAAFERAGIAPQDVDVIQLQDTDAGAEIIHMAECGFCADGDQEKLVADGVIAAYGVSVETCAQALSAIRRPGVQSGDDGSADDRFTDGDEDLVDRSGLGSFGRMLGLHALEEHDRGAGTHRGTDGDDVAAHPVDWCEDVEQASAGIRSVGAERHLRTLGTAGGDPHRRRRSRLLGPVPAEGLGVRSACVEKAVDPVPERQVGLDELDAVEAPVVVADLLDATDPDHGVGIVETDAHGTSPTELRRRRRDDRRPADRHVDHPPDLGRPGPVTQPAGDELVHAPRDEHVSEADPLAESAGAGGDLRCHLLPSARPRPS